MALGRLSRVETFDFDMPWENSHGYSQGFRIGEELRISGQMPHDDDGNLVGLGDPAQQANAVFSNLDRVLSAFGARRHQVVQTELFVIAMEKNLSPISQAHRSYFGDHRPSSSVFGVAELALPGQLLEMTAIARLDLR